ncbi:dehydrogenase [bacterium]|nr:dehydrogenase [bacterium]|tara:strand:- start:6517 stop:7527 length:1011 start_codon:yes stop_codon:yes gene_type:complete
MSDSKKIRFGILGCSRVAHKGVLPAIIGAESADLTMVGSRSLDKAEETAKEFDCAKWGTYEDVLKNKEVDAVYISIPPSLHEEWAVKAAQEGKHVYCEKPATVSYDEAKRMVETAQKNKVRLIEGLMFRYHPQNEKVREMIEGGELGEILRFNGCFSYDMPDQESNAMSKELGGGSLYSCGVYPISASRMVFNEEPISVFAKMRIDSKSKVDIETHVMMEFPNNKIAFVSSLFGAYYQSMYEVLGDKAHVRMKRAYAVPRDWETKMFVDKDDKVTEVIIKPADHFKLMIEDFCDEISKKEASTKDYEAELLAQSRVLEAVKRSSKENRVVNIEEIV